ncbi:hypothetical protein LUZ60_002125 [Juncus effusus]|nr:hypothetical protein LUZ60_002125 [Juncus effusus]
MDVQVRVIGGIESCFVSLPLSLIQTLERGLERDRRGVNGGFVLPPVLGLELTDGDGRKWFLAWSGSPSRSSSIEVPQRLAECVSLQDGMKAKLKVIPELQKAEMVTIEPATEDDWEILESRPESAEEVILTQVGVVYEGMKFPLCLYEHVVVQFLVTSISPNKSLVQLVPGTEVAVAPKRRKSQTSPSHDLQNPNPNSQDEKTNTKALLRVQSENPKNYVHQFMYKGVELGITLTCGVFINPESAQKLGFSDLDFGIVSPKFVPNEKSKNVKGDVGVTKGGLNSNSRERKRDMVVRLIYLDSVAKGHLMLPQSLRHYIGADLHSWVYVKKYSFNVKKDSPLFTISPLRFKLPRKNKPDENSEFDPYERENNTNNNINTYPSHNSIPLNYIEDFIASLSKEEGLIKKEKEFLIKSWLSGQIKAVNSQIDGKAPENFVFPNESLLHFEVVDRKLGNRKLELMYLLTVKFENGRNVNENFEIGLEGDLVNLEGFEMKLELGDPVSLETFVEGKSNGGLQLDLYSLSWMENAISDITKRLFVQLSPEGLKLLSKLDSPFPGHVLIFGPPGSGKTTLSRAVAQHLQDNEQTLTHIVYISCSKLAVEKNAKIKQTISERISDAWAHAPSIVIFDDLDNIIQSSSESDGSQPSNSSDSLSKYLIELINEFREKSERSCGYGPIAFLGTVQNVGNLPQALTNSGRFDFHVQLSAPAVPERLAILKHEIIKRRLNCSDEILSEIAPKCDGYDAYDLEILVDRAVHAASARFLSPLQNRNPNLVKDDFTKAMHDFVPVAMRGLTKTSSDGKNSGWSDVGGLNETKDAIQETLEMPSKFPDIFAQSPLRLRSNILLYGPPGCGKTHIVGAAASASSLRFISVKGPELLNKYIGASEQAVRDLFAKAAASAPCLLFFDEFDSIAPKRGHDNTGVTDRVVNQLLTELDGVETLNGVFVFAATSRPDLLDAALLRPGRFDRLLFCDFPQRHERLDILSVLSKKLPMSNDVVLEDTASATDGFSGADLQALLSDAQLAAVHRLLDSPAGVSGSSTGASEGPVISNEILRAVVEKARPSISEQEKKRLYGIYGEFMDSKKSLSAQMRDAKGKRATLA